MDTEKLIHKQIQEMNRHKWIESEKAGFDLGQDAMLDWAENFVDDFQHSIDKSVESAKKPTKSL